MILVKALIFLLEGAYITDLISFNLGGQLPRNDFQLVKSGIINSLKSNVVVQVTKKGNFYMRM